MNIDIDLRESAKEASDALKISNSNGTILKSPRSGKTSVMISYINHLVLKNPNLKVLWLCYDKDEQDHQLDAEFKYWECEHLLSNIDKIIYKSTRLFKTDISIYDLIIYNECHTITQHISEYLTSFGYNSRIIGLTGTYPNKLEKQQYLKDIGLDNIIFLYSFSEAVDDDIISDYNIIVNNLGLSTEKNIKIEYHNKVTNKPATFYLSEQSMVDNYINKLSDINTELLTYNTEKKTIQEQINSYKAYEDEDEKNQLLLRNLYQRNRVLVDLSKPLWEKKKKISFSLMQTSNSFDTKIKFAQNFIVNNPDKRILIFASNTDVSNKISKNNYNSKTDKQSLEDFQLNKINHIVLIEKAATGFNFHNIDTCIILSVNSSNTNITQKLSRGLVKDSENPLNVYIPYTNSTELGWIKEALINLDSNKIKII